MTRRVVRLREELLHRLTVREWGWPMMAVPGQIWRSNRGTVTCLLPKGRDEIKSEARGVEIVGRAEEEWFPANWQDAIWSYCRAWPDSAEKLVPFLRISEAERRLFVRELLDRVAQADDIGVLASARTAGLFATTWPEVMKW